MNQGDQINTIKTGAGHKQCDRCATVHAWFLKIALDGMNMTFIGREMPANRPENIGGWCTSCKTSFCSAHTDSKKCVLCGNELLQPPAEALMDKISVTQRWVKIPGFIAYKQYSWPDRCVCCFRSAETTATVVTEMDKQVVVAGLAKVGKSGNVEVNYDSYTKKGTVTIHVPYCKDCNGHDRLRNIGFPMMGCALSVVGLFVITGFLLSLFGLISLSELKIASLPVGFQIVGFIILPVLFVAGYVLKQIGDRKRKESCQKVAMGIVRSFPVELNVDRMGVGSLDFAQPRYAEAFTQANLSTAPGGKKQ